MRVAFVGSLRSGLGTACRSQKFGDLTETLAPRARYWDRDTRRTIPYSELVGSWLPRISGILELCAHEAQLLWEEDDSWSGVASSSRLGTVWRCEDLLVPPCILADTKGGTYYAAVAASVDGFRFEDAFNTARQGIVVVQMLTGELSSGNVRCVDGF